MTTYKHLAVIGRVDGDDEDSVVLYENLTIDEAEAAFREDMSEAAEEHRGVLAPADEIYINYVLTSEAPSTSPKPIQDSDHDHPHLPRPVHQPPHQGDDA